MKEWGCVVRCAASSAFTSNHMQGGRWEGTGSQLDRDAPV